MAVFLSMKKRNREEGNNGLENYSLTATLAMARANNYWMMVSRDDASESSREEFDRVFECKTCSRVFPSFQALGGHRASHKKPKLSINRDKDNTTCSSSSNSHGGGTLTEGSKAVVKPKTHECSICGLVFALGQALGGHMRRHRNAITGGDNNSVLPLVVKSKTNGSTSRGVLYFDLNLTPSENDGLEFKLRNTAPLLDFFLC